MFSIKLFLVLKITCLYVNRVMPLTYNISFTYIINHNYIKMYVKDRIDSLKEFKLITYIPHDEIIRY